VKHQTAGDFAVEEDRFGFQLHFLCHLLVGIRVYRSPVMKLSASRLQVTLPKFVFDQSQGLLLLRCEVDEVAIFILLKLVSLFGELLIVFAEYFLLSCYHAGIVGEVRESFGCVLLLLDVLLG